MFALESYTDAYGISVRRLSDGEQLLSNTEVFETCSAIKAPIGALALSATIAEGHDPNQYEFVIGRSHYSNGSGKLKDPTNDMGGLLIIDERTKNGTCRATVASLNMLNIQNSDCIATNALIDYLGDKCGVNSALRKLGLKSMELVTDRLHFPGVDHHNTTYQVGRSTMDDFTTFYTQLYAGIGFPSNVQKDLRYDLSQVEGAYLFGRELSDLPLDGSIKWEHKTGSVIDDRSSHSEFYGAIVDAGILTVSGELYAVAAAATVHRQKVTDELHLGAKLKSDFARRNLLALNGIGIGLPFTVVA